MDLIAKLPWFLPTLLFAIPFIWALLRWFSKTKGWWMGGIFGGVGAYLIGGSVLSLVIGVILGLLLDYLLSTVLFKQMGF